MSSTDAIDDAVETLAKHLKDSRVTKLKMTRLRCRGLSPNKIAAFCRGLHCSKSLEDFRIECDSSLEKVWLIGVLVIALFSHCMYNLYEDNTSL